jgi:hypothetical protein
MPGQSQPSNKNRHMYLPFLYNGYRYPRLARNFGENRREVREERRNDPSWSGGDAGTYRTFRPSHLCYMEKDETTGKFYFETRPVPPVSYDLCTISSNTYQDDHVPYLFISYSSAEYGRLIGRQPRNLAAHRSTSHGAIHQDEFQTIIAFAMAATVRHFELEPYSTRLASKYGAFWLDSECQPRAGDIETANNNVSILFLRMKLLI